MSVQQRERSTATPRPPSPDEQARGLRAAGSSDIIRTQVARFVGLAQGTERQLRDALLLVAERHERDYDLTRGATIMAGWRVLHLDWLKPMEERYGSVPAERPEKLRAALLGGTRVGGMGMLDDLRDLSLLTEESETTWTILYQAARELEDADLLRVAADAREHDKRTLRWLRTLLDHAAPEVLAVAANPALEVRASLPKAPDRLASIPDPVWGPVAGMITLGVAAIASLLVGAPFVFPSLGPTAALVAVEPANPASRAWNIVVGHAGGLVAGFVALAVFGALNAPTLFTDKVLDPGRAAASVLALGLTILVGMLLRANHPPAAATTLLVSLGGIRTMEDVLHLAVGVVLVAIAGELLRRVRLERMTPAERKAPEGGLIDAWLRNRKGSIFDRPPG
jgi:hypothetical protein